MATTTWRRSSAWGDLAGGAGFPDGHLERLQQPVLAGRIPPRPVGADRVRPRRGGRLRRHRVRPSPASSASTRHPHPRRPPPTSARRHPSCMRAARGAAGSPTARPTAHRHSGDLRRPGRQHDNDRSRSPAPGPTAGRPRIASPGHVPELRSRDVYLVARPGVRAGPRRRHVDGSPVRRPQRGPDLTPTACGHHQPAAVPRATGRGGRPRLIDLAVPGGVPSVHVYIRLTRDQHRLSGGDVRRRAGLLPGAVLGTAPARVPLRGQRGRRRRVADNRRRSDYRARLVAGPSCTSRGSPRCSCSWASAPPASAIRSARWSASWRSPAASCSCSSGWCRGRAPPARSSSGSGGDAARSACAGGASPPRTWSGSSSGSAGRRASGPTSACAGPGSEQRPRAHRAALLLAYSIGLGLPFVLIALLGRRCRRCRGGWRASARPRPASAAP